MNRMKEMYNNEVAPALMQKFQYKSVMQIPKLDKIVVSVGCGDCKDNAKALEAVIKDISAITGQHAVATVAKKSVANFKLRAGMNIGVKVTLRGERMYEFLDRFFNVALPRVRALELRLYHPVEFAPHGQIVLKVVRTAERHGLVLEREREHSRKRFGNNGGGNDKRGIRHAVDSHADRRFVVRAGYRVLYFVRDLARGRSPRDIDGYILVPPSRKFHRAYRRLRRIGILVHGHDERALVAALVEGAPDKASAVRIAAASRLAAVVVRVVYMPERRIVRAERSKHVLRQRRAVRKRRRHIGVRADQVILPRSATDADASGTEVISPETKAYP